MLLLFIHILVATVSNTHAVLKLENNLIENNLTKYIEIFKECCLIPRGTCFYTSDNDDHVKQIMNRFISSLNNCASLVMPKKNNRSDSSNIVQAHDIFVFIEKTENILDGMKYIKKSKLWVPQTRVHIIFCSQLETKRFIPSTLQNIWNLNIYNFVFVTVQQRVGVYTFNNFLTKKINFIETFEKLKFCQQLFFDKVRNLQGISLRVGLFEKLPIIYWDEESECFKGPDAEIMKLFLRFTNSTSKTFYTTDSFISVDSLHKNETDIIFVGILQVSKYFLFYFNIFLVMNN